MIKIGDNIPPKASWILGSSPRMTTGEKLRKNLDSRVKAGKDGRKGIVYRAA